FGRAPVAVDVDARVVKDARGKDVHRRRSGPPRHLQIEGRLRGHRGAVHEQDRADGLGRVAGVFLPQEQPHVRALLRPMLLAANGTARHERLVYRFRSTGFGRACAGSSAPRRTALARLPSTSTMTSAPTSKCSSGWVCTPSTSPDGIVAEYYL